MNNRGSTLAAALALAFLIFAVTTFAFTQVALSYGQISMRHGQTSALFLAEAGINRAANRLMVDKTYRGEQNIQMPTGTFDVTVAPSGNGYLVAATGRAKSALKNGQKKTVRATIRLLGSGSYRLEDWRENQ